MKQVITTGISALAFAALLGGCAGSSGGSDTQNQANNVKTQHQNYDAKAFYETTSYFGSGFSHDGESILMGSDESGVFNVYSMDVKTGNKTQLTDSPDTSYPVSWFPKDKRVLFTKDSGGNERYHVYVLEQDGTVKDLTPGDETRASFRGFTKDGSAFFVTSNERDPKFNDLYRYDSKDYSRKLVFTNNAGYEVGDVGPKGHFVALGKTHSNRDSDVYILDLRKRGEPELISEHTEPANYMVEGFSVDGRSLYYGTDSKGEFSQIWQYDMPTGKHSQVLADDWDVTFIRFSDSGRYQVSGVNADASSKVSILDTKTGKPLALPPLPAGDIRAVRFSDDETQMAFYLNSDTSPSNLYVWSLGAPEARKLTEALNPAMDTAHLVPSEVVRFESFDGLDIPGLLYKPKQASADNPAPVMIWVHGGPGGQSRSGYNPTIQHLVNQGYGIFAINNRGSSGYGKTFFHLDDKQHGEGDLQDMVWGKAYLQGLDWVDDERIGIMGGSYGGYMTAAALAFEPETFKVGIDIFGVTNWVRTLNSIPPWWESFRKALYDEMGDPATDGERHRAISPLFHATNITKPLMVVQGANDPRVLQVESDELVEKVRENGVPVEYVLFEDEGHGFTKKVNRITASEAYLKFLQTHL
ncbi:S9 family peptidase [Shewanella corallii]|uniref:S9 family peptidase n=1 Tax=Shewanella corallii TaxID=560080 RepID=A0ABT0N876_9GAMM|nr:alpha/beta fold hydrolase [Shewanella corallii]MCL2914666.1 S9 family peptidase [Shewanella corallii]